jgi:sugar lactone lactonase YvrE
MPRPIACLIALALSLLGAAEPEPRWRTLNHAARDAVQAKDYVRLRVTLQELKPLLPGNPRIAYNLAASEAMLGNREAAIAALRYWSAMGLVYDVGADDDFASIRGTPEFQKVLDRVAQSKLPVTHSVTAFTLPARDILPEDIAYDPKTRRFFISSVRKGFILAIGGAGDSREFARSEWPVLALRVDPGRRLLWATTGYVPHGESVKESDKDKTALLAFDLDSGAQKQRIASPLPGLLGDMTISRRGDLYISEGIHGAVLRLKAGASTLERLDTEGDFPSPQTPALSADEKTLYVPDYLRGIAAMQLDTRHVEWLQPAPGIALSGIDGFYVHHNSFLAAQNGTTPPRLIRFSLDLRQQEVLEANTPGLGEPTHGTFDGDDFYFLANSGWNEYDQDGKKKAGSASVESTVRKLRLPRGL